MVSGKDDPVQILKCITHWWDPKESVSLYSVTGFLFWSCFKIDSWYRLWATPYWHMFQIVYGNTVYMSSHRDKSGKVITATVCAVMIVCFSTGAYHHHSDGCWIRNPSWGLSEGSSGEYSDRISFGRSLSAYQSDGTRITTPSWELIGEPVWRVYR